MSASVPTPLDYRIQRAARNLKQARKLGSPVRMTYWRAEIDRLLDLRSANRTVSTKE